MAHRPHLNDIKGDFGDPSTNRLYRVVLDGDDPVISHHIKSEHQSLAQDYDNALERLSSQCRDVTVEPAYFMIRLDGHLSNDQWLFITYVPEETHPQKKMRYAYSQNAIKKNLASLKFTDSLFASSWDEITYKGYQSHLASQKVSALTLEEQERSSLDKASAQMATCTPIGLPGITAGGRIIPISGHLSGGNTNVPGNPTFPIDDAAKASVESGVMIGGHAVLTVVKEIITHHITVTPLQCLASHLPSDMPAFIVTRVNDSTLVMTFYCPEGTRVKDRMIASSARGSVLRWLESLVPKFQLGKRVEVSDVEDIPTLNFMRSECGLDLDGDPRHTTPEAKSDEVPSTVLGINAQHFRRPRPPGRHRGVV